MGIGKNPLLINIVFVFFVSVLAFVTENEGIGDANYAEYDEQGFLGNGTSLRAADDGSTAACSKSCTKKSDCTCKVVRGNLFKKFCHTADQRNLRAGGGGRKTVFVYTALRYFRSVDLVSIMVLPGRVILSVVMQLGRVMTLLHIRCNKFRSEYRCIPECDPKIPKKKCTDKNGFWFAERFTKCEGSKPNTWTQCQGSYFYKGKGLVPIQKEVECGLTGASCTGSGKTDSCCQKAIHCVNGVCARICVPKGGSCSSSSAACCRMHNEKISCHEYKCQSTGRGR